ncbi:glycosyltransferase [Mesorhizobium sp. AR07]|uniref:glycosyltransferase n=1 Tax=Mesorhizobium sp. AR07 TaxID=2865838 RepID=UPI00215ED327|nr:glycosyltransferase [Mesorhizobium sp. AR07]UVK45144.1 glycosyltransferase [Mesorhizobium sp. AR07]
MTFEFRIPILPEQEFFSNVKLAALSLASLGGAYATAPIVVSVGGHTGASEVCAVNRWSSAYPVTWRPVPHAVSDRGFSSGFDRYVEPPRGDVIILADADACLMRPIDGLLQSMRDAERPSVAGLPAHFSPFSRNGAENDAAWRQLLKAFGFGDTPLNCRYSQSPDEAFGGCPGYFNYGFVVFNKTAFTAIQPLIRPLTERVLDYLKDKPSIFFSGQIALSLAILTVGADPLPLGPEYNCPNSDEMLAYGLRDPADIRVLHYLRREQFDRHSFLCNRDEFDAFCNKSFASPVLQAFQQHVRSLPYPFYEEGARQ